jgi:hypothetical protein
MDLLSLSARERLIAEQAVLTLRALDQAADAAPHGQGLAYLENCIDDKGREHLRAMLASTLSARSEAQKKGSVCGLVRAGKRPNTRGATAGKF